MHHIKGDTNPMLKSWKPEDDAMLLSMNQKGLSLKTMAKRLNRTENAVRLRAKHKGIKLNIKGRRWTEEEEQKFAEDWQNETINNDTLVRKHNRTWHALQEKAVMMKLGPRVFDSRYLTIQDVCEEMKVSNDRVYRWISHGLPTHKSGSRRRKYLIDSDELLQFLEKHQSWFQASTISKYIFGEEPDWLVEKRKKDRLHNRNRRQREWTNDEDRRLQMLHKRGASLSELADEFHRSESAVRTHLYVIGCEIKRKDVYTDHEIKILTEYSDYYTLKELEDMLPGRTAKGIEYKCKMLKLPYHFAKENCKSPDTKTAAEE